MELLGSEQIEAAVGGTGWRMEANALTKEFPCPDFKGALSFIQRVGEEAERQNHHPDILLHSYNKVRLTLSTHSAGGVTEADLRLAQAVDRLR